MLISFERSPVYITFIGTQGDSRICVMAAGTVTKGKLDLLISLDFIKCLLLTVELWYVLTSDFSQFLSQTDFF